MTEIRCAATGCRYNDYGQCAKGEITLAFIAGSQLDLHCTAYESSESKTGPALGRQVRKEETG